MYILGIFFLILGFGIKYGKLYFLIAGYNTMSKSEKAKVDIEGIANLFWHVMLGMAITIILSSLISHLFDVPEVEEYAVLPTVITGVVWLVLRSNSDKYRIDR